MKGLLMKTILDVIASVMMAIVLSAGVALADGPVPGNYIMHCKEIYGYDECSAIIAKTGDVFEAVFNLGGDSNDERFTGTFDPKTRILRFFQVVDDYKASMTVQFPRTARSGRVAHSGITRLKLPSTGAPSMATRFHHINS
jgi:hypothetical protein